MTEPDKLIAKRLMEYLPAIYSEDPAGETVLQRFLFAFEVLLLDVPFDDDDLDFAVDPLERKISRLHLVFNPQFTPKEFLSWLASWAALTLSAELSLAKKRRLLAEIIKLYRIRGTRKYLERLLALSLDASCVVNDAELPAFQVGAHSTVGFDTRLGGGPPHYFQIRMVAPKLSASQVTTQTELAIRIIEAAKPAHTFYELETVTAEMQVGTHSTVGLDTVLGAPPAK
jgi:phage tail-like protein